MRWEIFGVGALALAAMCSCSVAPATSVTGDGALATPVIATELCGVPDDKSADVAMAAISQAIDEMTVDDYALEIYEDPQPLAEPSIDFEPWTDAQRPIVVAIGPRTAAWGDPAVYAAAQPFRCVAVDAADAAKWGVTSPAIVVCDFRWNMLHRFAAPTDAAGCLQILELKGEPLHEPVRMLGATAPGTAGAAGDGNCAAGTCGPGGCANGACGKSRGLFGR